MQYDPRFPNVGEVCEGLLPFTLLGALSGKWKIVTRSGIEIPSLHYFIGSGITNPVCGVINDDVENWTIEGKYFSDRNNSAYDLFLKKKTVIKWVNLYKSMHPREPIACAHDTYDSAVNGAKSNCPPIQQLIAKAIRIEYEE